MNIKSKVLPRKDPPITAYLYHSCLLSVLLNHKECIPWLYNNYIQLYTEPAVEGVDFGRVDFYFPYSVWKSCPFIYYQRISYKLVDVKWKSIVDCLKDCIDLDYYVQLDYDRYYIPEMRAYRKYHINHNLFIYGYDDNTEEFYVNGHVASNEYKSFKVSYSNLKLAYDNKITDENKYIDNGLNGIELITYYDKRSHKLNIQYIIQSIKDYIYGINTIKRVYPADNWRYCRERTLFGVNIYKNIYYYLEESLSINPDHIETRLLHVLQEHKKVMLMRIKYLSELGYIDNAQYFYTRFKDVVNSADIAKSLHNKYSVTKDQSLIPKIIAYVRKIERDEKIILEYLLDHMNDNQYCKKVCIDESIDTYPYVQFITKKKGDYQLIDKISPVYENKNEKSSWITLNPEIAKIDNDIYENKSVIQFIAKGNTTLNGLNENGEVKSKYELYCVEPGFITNIKYKKRYQGNWQESDSGLIGDGDHEYIFFGDAGSNIIFESDIKITALNAAPNLIIRAKSDLSDFYCIVLCSEDGTIRIWQPGGVLVNVPAGIKKQGNYTVKIVTNANKIDVFLDKNLVISYEEAKIKGGYCGLMATGQSIYQNVQIISEFYNSKKDETEIQTDSKYNGFCGLYQNDINSMIK